MVSTRSATAAAANAAPPPPPPAANHGQNNQPPLLDPVGVNPQGNQNPPPAGGVFGGIPIANQGAGAAFPAHEPTPAQIFAELVAPNPAAVDRIAAIHAMTQTLADGETHEGVRILTIRDFVLDWQRRIA